MIPKALILQPAKAVHSNVGEITPKGMSKLIASLSSITEEDIFVDIGAGVGNVVVQIALETPASTCIALEMRADVLKEGRRLIANHESRYPALDKIIFIDQDLRELDSTSRNDLSRATILYSFNTLFEHDSLLALEQFICDQSCLRHLILAVKPCWRHRHGCMREFCLLWTLDIEVQVEVTYKCTQASLHVYKRRWI